VAGHRQESRFGAVGRVGLIAGLGERPFGLGAVGDVAADALHLRRLAGIGTHQAFAPCDPSRSQRGCDPLVVNPGTVGFNCRVTLLEDIKREVAADQRAARQLGPVRNRRR